MHPVLHIGDASVGSYGLLVTLGYLVGIVWLMRHIEDMNGSVLEFWSLAYTVVFGALVGAKLGYLIVEWPRLRAAPWRALANWRTGWVFWFGVAGCVFAGVLFQQAYNRLYRPRRYLPVADYFLSALPVGHWIGRLGCFMKGCCYGRPTSLPWGVRFTDPASKVRSDLLGVPLHPTQLYESAGELAIGLFLVFHVLPHIRRGRYAYGAAFYGYIVLYSALRFVVEFFRGDDRGVFLSPVLSPSQWASLAGFLIAGGLLYRQGIIERRPKTRSIFV